MINSIDPYDLPGPNCLMTEGIRRGKIFWDFIEVEEHIKNMISKEVIKDPKLLINCINQIKPLFKKENVNI
jgi:hypothetical protein